MRGVSRFLAIKKPLPYPAVFPPFAYLHAFILITFFPFFITLLLEFFSQRTTCVIMSFRIIQIGPSMDPGANVGEKVGVSLSGGVSRWR